MGPPQISSNVVNRHIFRFAATGLFGGNITANFLLGAVGNICHVANTAVMSIAGSAKLHRVSVYSPPATQGAFSTCSLTWLSAQADAPSLLEVSDTTVSTAQPAHITTVPPKESGASFWFTSSTDPLFHLDAPVGSIIDVDLFYVLNDTGVAGFASTVAAGTLGVMYWLALDGPANNKLVPVSLFTTA
jgi:hypothetical protein